VERAIATIGEHAWTPVHYPGAESDPETGELISDADQRVSHVNSPPVLNN
jgi:hypothetical protein